MTKTVPGTQTPFKIVISDSHRQQVADVRPQSLANMTPIFPFAFSAVPATLSLSPHRLHVLLGCYNFGGHKDKGVYPDHPNSQGFMVASDQMVREPF